MDQRNYEACQMMTNEEALKILSYWEITKRSPFEQRVIAFMKEAPSWRYYQLKRIRKSEPTQFILPLEDCVKRLGWQVK